MGWAVTSASASGVRSVVMRPRRASTRLWRRSANRRGRAVAAAAGAGMAIAVMRRSRRLADGGRSPSLAWR